VIQNQPKILANATSYGIFIEVVTEDRPASVRAYGLSTFDAKVKKTEEFGNSSTRFWLRAKSEVHIVGIRTDLDPNPENVIREIANDLAKRLEIQERVR